ncbi:hypothetical protein FOH10_29435 [Nocardia otitidiscaviarum]|uniref:GNAT family N-acetyltransferase n=1 Tax=Nocardia otitidiscaviarum TaxID=1823 RepID=A0A516NTK8_9NOCA|nr:hypothetical protein [Nocardia otitidiscaviarum]MCP9621576.1 hypothetical protein [Nocardia otitidiscaviarum]QDP82242.1 hypothetical protein FOH10_29435 [Nocardia otitidiscaviarum]
MSASRVGGVELLASHPEDDPLLRVWVAVDGGDDALAVFVAFLAVEGTREAYDRGAYTVIRARRRGHCKELIELARLELTAEQPPVQLRFSGKATPAGYAVAHGLGATPPPFMRMQLPEGQEYSVENQEDADAFGFEALCAAARRLGLPVPEL